MEQKDIHGVTPLEKIDHSWTRREIWLSILLVLLVGSNFYQKYTHKAQLRQTHQQAVMQLEFGRGIGGSNQLPHIVSVRCPNCKTASSLLPPFIKGD